MGNEDVVMTTEARGLKGHGVLVVGAAGGIGAAITQRCVADGARVVGWDLESPAADLNDHGLLVDATNPDAVKSAMTDTLDLLGSLDAVVLASGTVGRGWLHETSLSEWQRVLEANLTAAFLVLRAALPFMFEHGGSVVTIGSTASTVITDGGTAASYAASKAGLLQLTRQVAVDYASHGIRANCVCPGWIHTEMNDRSRVAAGEAWTNERLPRTALVAPIPGAGSPEQVAGTVRFLLGADAEFITGSAIMVDGGYTAL